MFWVVVVKNTDTQADRPRPTGALKGTVLICPAELCDSPNRRQQKRAYAHTQRYYCAVTASRKDEETLFILAEGDEDAVKIQLCFFTSLLISTWKNELQGSFHHI